ncbi:MAG TPA: DUF2971 domain-containing protein [Terriglobales bacterium]|nr:DUF2971 domain-containing protein [Terriglobales bacterium]
MGVVDKIFAEEPAGPIYHYTSNEGFLGIIETKTLWASKLHYLNDSTEFAYALGLIRANLENRLRHERGPWNGFYGKALEGISAIENVHVFVACFSEVGDLLSQWRGYCPDSVGYSVAFERQQLEEPMLRQGFRLVRCVYDEERQNAIVNEIINSAGQGLDPAAPGAAATQLVQRIPEVAPALKHPKFSEEREWRLASMSAVSILAPQVRFRPSRWSLVPYYAFELCAAGQPLTLSHVYVGPNPHMQLAEAAAFGALWNAGVKFAGSKNHPPIDVRPSSVPYRGW